MVSEEFIQLKARKKSEAEGKRVRRMFARKGGTLRTRDVLRAGVHPRTLYALRDSGVLEQMGRGLYRLAGRDGAGNPDVMVVASRVPKAVVCLISALSHHGLTTQIPHAVNIAMPSHAQVPKVDGVPVRVFWYPAASLRAGAKVSRIDGVRVRIFSAEKTIADCFKYRNKLGTDLAVEALRMYREQVRKPDRAALLEFARINRVVRVMTPYLEAIL
jgi:predicted transcriptional regulator of viral defense system